MEVSKFRLQLSSVVEHQVTARLWQIHHKFTKGTRIAAERARRLGYELRTRENGLRVLLVARSREAIIAANSKVTKAKAQLSIAFEQGTARLRQAQNRFAGLTRNIAEKPQKLPEELRGREDELRALEARPREAIVGANRVTKVKAEPPAALEQWTAHLLQVQNPLAGLTRSIAEKPQKLPEEPRAWENELRVLEARPQEAIVEADSKVTKVKAQLSVASEQGTARLRQTQKTLSRLAWNIVNKRQRGRQELSARESQMRELLANSPEAIVVINGDHRFVAANRRALDLFGVSERNLSKFNIDVFLSRGQIPDLRRNGSFFKRRQVRHGQCMISRLDGSVRIAEFALVTDFLPLQHLCRFYDPCVPQRPTPMHHGIRPETPARCAPSR